MNAPDVFEWLEASPLAVYIRRAHLLYPIIEIVHIVGFIFLTGTALLFDFRLLGISKRIPVIDLANHLLPWSRRSLILVIPSGLLLFMTQATELSQNRIFWTKLILIVLALTNAALFHLFTFKKVIDWNHLKPTPVSAKAAGVISIALWLGVITCGRFLAYLE